MTKLYRKTRTYLRAAIALVLLAASHILLAQAAQSSTDPSFPRTQNQDKTDSWLVGELETTLDALTELVNADASQM